MKPQEYLDLNKLWDLESLKKHAQEHSVYVIQSDRFPGLAMLHYMDECQYKDNWTDFSLMSRGLLLDLINKKVLHWGFSKFFNMGQRSDISYEILKNKGSFEVSEKLDGSLILLMQNPNTGSFHCLTKGSMDSEHGLYATQIMPKVLKDQKLVEKYSLVFELIAKQFQIVINYNTKGYAEGLYLTGAREKATNRLLSYVEVVNLAKELGIPCVKIYSFESLDQLIEETQNLGILDEGFVLRWEPELLVKLKGPKYLEMHRYISNLSDKNILLSIAENSDKTLIEVCPEEYLTEVINKIKYFKNRIVELTNICDNFYKQAPHETRKEFAIWVNQNVPNYFRGFLFQLFDKKELLFKDVCKTIEIIDHIDGRTRI